MTETTTKCDHCGTVKQESNHWHKAYIISHGFYEKGSLVLGSHSSESPSPRDIDLCSEACVVECVSQFIGQKQERFVEPVQAYRDTRPASVIDDDSPF